MSKFDTARTFYESARQELIERIKLRDNIALIFWGAIGAIFGIAFGTSIYTDILLIVPYLSFGCVIMISQHNSVIGCLADYINNELNPIFTEENKDTINWDRSSALKKYLSHAIWYRTISHFILIVIPSILASFVLVDYYSCLNSYKNVFWWLGVLLTLFTIVIIILSHLKRKEVQSRIK
jgi:hypothetical protein